MKLKITLGILILGIVLLFVIPMALGIGGFRRGDKPAEKPDDNRVPHLIRSDDEGKTWFYARAVEHENNKKSDTPTATTSDVALLKTTQILDFVFHPSDQDTIFIGTKTAGLWKSADGGKEWTHILDDPKGLHATSTIYRVAISQADPSILYLAVFQNHRGRVLRSTDGGEAFSEIFFTPAPEIGIPALAVDPANSNHVLIGTGQGGLLETADAGATWAVEKWFDGAIADFIISPDDFDEMYVIAAGGKIFAPDPASKDKWKDATATFGKSTAYRPQVRYSLFGGATIVSDTGRRIITDPHDFASLYTLSAIGISHSPDAGKTWTQINALIPPGTAPDIRDLAVSPRDSAHIFAVANGQLHETRDGGGTWHHMLIPGIPGLQRIYIHPLNPDTFFALVRE